MKRCSFREWIPILPWPIWPLAWQCSLGQNAIMGSMTLLLAVRGNIATRSMSGPPFALQRHRSTVWCRATPGVALGQNEPHTSREAIPVPRRQQHHKAQAKKPRMMFACTPFLRDRILGPPFVGVAAVAKQIHDTVRRGGQGRHEVVRQ